MSDNKGMILIETLLLFVIVSILLLIMTSCILSLHQMHDLERGMYQNEEIKALYE